MKGPGGEVELEAGVLVSELVAGQRKPELEDRLLCAKQKSVPADCHRPLLALPQPQPLFGHSDRGEDTSRQRPVRLGVDRESADLTRPRDRRRAVTLAVGNASDDPGGPPRLAGGTRRNRARGEAESDERRAGAGAGSGELAAPRGHRPPDRRRLRNRQLHLNLAPGADRGDDARWQNSLNHLDWTSRCREKCGGPPRGDPSSDQWPKRPRVLEVARHRLRRSTSGNLDSLFKEVGDRGHRLRRALPENVVPIRHGDQYQSCS